MHEGSSMEQAYTAIPEKLAFTTTSVTALQRVACSVLVRITVMASTGYTHLFH